MSKLVICLFGLFFLILFQQSSYGFIEGDEVISSSNFDIEMTSDIITMDLTPQENPAKRYLIYGSGSLDSAYTDRKNIVYGINSDKGFFSVGILTENEAVKLKLKGYHVIEDFALDFNSRYVSTNAITKTSQFGNLANSEQVHKLYNVTGNGVTVAVFDTGVDFSNPDIRDSVARDKNNIPIMLDPDGQGLVFTNSTFAANIDNGRVYNFTKNITLPENATSNVYESNDGVFLNTLSRNGTISVYNAFYPYYGSDHVIEAQITGDMKIGKTAKDFIQSKSGIYHLGAIIASHIGKLQVIIVLVTDPNEAGVYDTITPDMSTSCLDFTKPDQSRPDNDIDFND